MRWKSKFPFVPKRHECYRCHRKFVTYDGLVAHANQTGHSRRRVSGRNPE